jgi:signal peptidase I
MDNYAGRTPQRGDVIMFAMKDQPLSYAKRIIGVEGDVIAPGGDNILVNNKGLEIPRACGQPSSHRPELGELPPFEPLTVPKNSYFVVGDNLTNSYDSRHFGVITRAQIRGQMLYIYLSSRPGRIGCAIR